MIPREEDTFGMLFLVLELTTPNAWTGEDPRMQQRDERTNDNFMMVQYYVLSADIW